MADVVSKVCTGCKAELPFGEFYKHKAGKYGLKPQCKACVKAYNAANRERISDYHRNYRKRNLAHKLEYDRNYSLANRESRAEYQKWYREARRDELAEYQRGYRRAHSDRIRVLGREYYKANRERRSECAKEYYLANREASIARVREWMKANPEAVAEQRRRRRARKRDSTVVRFSDSELSARMSYWGNKCWQCGGPFEEVDHVKPLAKGGPHMLSNLRPSCLKCNRSKGQKWPLQEFRV